MVSFKKTLTGKELAVYDCPHCDASLNSPVEEIGIKDSCPECGEEFFVPGTQELEIRRRNARIKREEAEAKIREAEAQEAKKKASAATFVPNSTTNNQNKTPEHDLFYSRMALSPIEVIFAGILCFVLIGFPIMIYMYLSSIGSSLTITQRRSTYRRGILSKQTSEVFHKDVRNVQVSQGLIERIFDIGKIGISSSGQDGFEIQIRVHDPYKAKKIIDDAR